MYLDTFLPSPVESQEACAISSASRDMSLSRWSERSIRQATSARRIGKFAERFKPSVASIGMIDSAVNARKIPSA
jgi:hypothetical protein